MAGGTRTSAAADRRPAALHGVHGVVFICVSVFLLLCSCPLQGAPSLVTQLQQRLGMTEPQVRGALGAMLVFAQEHLSKDDFDQLAKQVPNATQIMQDVKLRGIVTRPLDDIEEYQESLASLGIGQPLASQFAPAVLDCLAASGHQVERDILGKILE